MKNIKSRFQEGLYQSLLTNEMKGMEITIREANKSDVEQIIEIDNDIWTHAPATKEMIISRIETFPEGQIIAIMNNKVVGAVFSERIDYEKWRNKSFSWYEITDNGTIAKSHDPKGKDLYGVGLTVSINHQEAGIGTQLMIGLAKKVLCLGIKSCYLGARMVEYYKHSNMSPEEYLNKSLDPEIEFYKKRGFKIIKLLDNYIEDPLSRNYGVLMMIRAPFYYLPFSIRKLVGIGINQLPNELVKKLVFN